MAANTYRILVINPGSTSTKLGLYENEHCVYSKDIQHDLEELSRFNLVADQLDYREQIVRQVLQEAGITLHSPRRSLPGRQATHPQRGLCCERADARRRSPWLPGRSCF